MLGFIWCSGSVQIIFQERLCNKNIVKRTNFYSDRTLFKSMLCCWLKHWLNFSEHQFHHMLIWIKNSIYLQKLEMHWSSAYSKHSKEVYYYYYWWFHLKIIICNLECKFKASLLEKASVTLFISIYTWKIGCTIFFLPTIFEKAFRHEMLDYLLE